MVELQQIKNALTQLVERKIIIYLAAGYYKFTEYGWNYTEQRSRDSWCDITWYHDGADRLWVPYKVFDDEKNKYDWNFCKFDEIEDIQFERFYKYFEIDNFVDSITEIDDIYL